MSTTETFSLADRLHQVEDIARTALTQRTPQAAPEETLVEEAALVVPRPRVARMYVRTGARSGGFTNVTITHPIRATA